MFIIKLLRLLTGYVVFSGRNGFPERFINLCAQSGINLWDARVSDGRLEAKTSIRGYRNIRNCAKKSGMKIRITKKCGLPFILKPYFKRKGLAVGAALSVILTVFLSSCIWTIDVSGNEKYTQEQILELAQHYGIRTGAFRKNIDNSEIKYAVKKDWEHIGWFAVNYDGTALSIELSEREDTRTDEKSNDPCNIIAGTDGEILKLDAYTGTAEISVGSAVKKGDLLISGIRNKDDGTIEFVHAKGNAIIRTKKEISVSVNKKTACKKIISVDRNYALCLLNLEIPLGKKNTVSNRISASMLVYDGVKLPVGIKIYSTDNKASQTLTLNSHKAALMCAYITFLQEKDVMHNAVTENKQFILTDNSDSTSLTAVYTNHETSGIEYYFVVEDYNSIGKNTQ